MRRNLRPALAIVIVVIAIVVATVLTPNPISPDVEVSASLRPIETTTTVPETTTTIAPTTTVAPTTTEPPPPPTTTTAPPPPTTTTAPPPPPPTTVAPPTTEAPPAPVAAPAGSIEQIIYAAAAEFGVDGNLMLRIARCESNLTPSAVNSSSGALGLFQHMPQYWGGRASALGYGYDAWSDPTANSRVSAVLMRDGGPGHWRACL